MESAATRVCFWESTEEYRTGIVDAGDGELVHAAGYFGNTGSMVGYRYDPLNYDDPQADGPAPWNPSG